MDSIILYNKIIRLARKKGMTIPQLYKRAGISDGTLRSWQKNGSYPSLYVLEGLCHALDLPLSKLFEHETEGFFTGSERQILDMWETLTKEQKQAIIELIRVFKQ